MDLTLLTLTVMDHETNSQHMRSLLPVVPTELRRTSLRAGIQ